MSKNFLSFLGGAAVEEVATSSKKGGGGPRKQWNPNPTVLAIRVHADGSVYPSQALVDKFDLNYRDAAISFEDIAAVAEEKDENGKIIKKAKEATKKRIVKPNEPVGNGMDVIDTRIWGQWKAEGDMLFISPVSKDQPRVDLFARTEYTDEGKPKANVLDQGAATFGKDVMIPAINVVYGLDLGVEYNEDGTPSTADQKGTVKTSFVDLVVVDEFNGINFNKQFSRPVMNFPKRVARGDKAGEETYIRREGAVLYGLLPISMTLGDQSTSLEDEATEIENESKPAQEIPETIEA